MPTIDDMPAVGGVITLELLESLLGGIIDTPKGAVVLTITSESDKYVLKRQKDGRWRRVL